MPERGDSPKVGGAISRQGREEIGRFPHLLIDGRSWTPWKCRNKTQSGRGEQAQACIELTVFSSEIFGGLLRRLNINRR